MQGNSLKYSPIFDRNHAYTGELTYNGNAFNE